jgi:hypothetical protein
MPRERPQWPGGSCAEIGHLGSTDDGGQLEALKTRDAPAASGQAG